jgi:sensor histidine kinase YesM
MLIYFLFHFVRGVRKEEQLKIQYQLKMTELEAKALRAQMNPHFIFNCLNSIKALIQEDQKQKSVTYLTTFSKLIRTLFNNADKKEITLYDEIETCKLYLQLEAMRFDAKFSYAVNVDDMLDLKSILVPALIVQPFIENAIWHGIVPRGGGGIVSLSVLKNNGDVDIVIDDDGIGRAASQQNKSASNIGHQSKGVNLTQSRLELDNLLQQRKAILKTIDKEDSVAKNVGTKVIIKLPQED